MEAMRAAIFHEPRRIETGDRPDSSLRQPTTTYPTPLKRGPKSGIRAECRLAK